MTYYSPYPHEPGDPRGWAPYGAHPITGQPLSDKTKVAAGLLQLLLPLIGIPGVGRLYAGHVGIGLAQLLGAIVSYVLICAIIGLVTMWGFLLWSFIDGIVILAGNVRDGQGRLLR